MYGLPALEANNGFTNAQCECYSSLCTFAFWPVPALLNLIETVLNIIYLYLAHVAAWPPASLVGFVSASMTLSKTVLYWAQEYYCGFCSIGHNTVYDLIIYWIIPNGCVSTTRFHKLYYNVSNISGSGSLFLPSSLHNWDVTSPNRWLTRRRRRLMPSWLLKRDKWFPPACPRLPCNIYWQFWLSPRIAWYIHKYSLSVMSAKKLPL